MKRRGLFGLIPGHQTGSTRIRLEFWTCWQIAEIFLHKRFLSTLNTSIKVLFLASSFDKKSKINKLVQNLLRLSACLRWISDVSRPPQRCAASNKFNKSFNKVVGQRSFKGKVLSRRLVRLTETFLYRVFCSWFCCPACSSGSFWELTFKNRLCVSQHGGHR